MTASPEPDTLYFSAGVERWSGKLRAVRTRWEDNYLVEVVPVESIPEGEKPIPLRKRDLERLQRGESPFDKPWNRTRR